MQAVTEEDDDWENVLEEEEEQQHCGAADSEQTIRIIVADNHHFRPAVQEQPTTEANKEEEEEEESKPKPTKEEEEEQEHPTAKDEGNHPVWTSVEGEEEYSITTNTADGIGQDQGARSNSAILAVADDVVHEDHFGRPPNQQLKEQEQHQSSCSETQNEEQTSLPQDEEAPTTTTTIPKDDNEDDNKNGPNIVVGTPLSNHDENDNKDLPPIPPTRNETTRAARTILLNDDDSSSAATDMAVMVKKKKTKQKNPAHSIHYQLLQEKQPQGGHPRHHWYNNKTPYDDTDDDTRKGLRGIRTADADITTSSRTTVPTKITSSSLSPNHHKYQNNNTSMLTPAQIQEYQQAFDRDGTGRTAQNAASATNLWRVTQRLDIRQASLSPNFDVTCDQPFLPATDQQASGRCWMFATLNLLRGAVCDELRLDNFEFSESYLLLFHLLEQSNFFLNRMIDFAAEGRPLEDRVLHLMLNGPIDDGGDWTTAKNLITKYGLVPKEVFPETYSSSNTDDMLGILVGLLRTAACRIRRKVSLAANQSPRETGNDGTATAMTTTNRNMSDDQNSDLQCYKRHVLCQVYRILCIHLGTPPTQFDWTWQSNSDDDDDDNNNDDGFHRATGLTPLTFAEKFVNSVVPYDSFVLLINDPRHDYYQQYTVDFVMPVEGGPYPAIFLNVPIEEIRLYCLQMLSNGDPVWFASNVEVELDDGDGLWDQNLYDIPGFYNLQADKSSPLHHDNMTKAERLEYGGDFGDHVMLLTAVETQECPQTKTTKCLRWRVENSWGQDTGDNGYYTMNDNWFDDNVFEIVAPPQYLTNDAKAGLETTPIPLPAWDPMCRGRKKR